MMFKADIRRMLKTRTIYTCIIVMAAFIIIAAISLNALLNSGSFVDITYAIEGLDQSSSTDMSQIRKIAGIADSIDSPKMDEMRQKLRSYISFDMFFKLPFLSNLFFVFLPVACVSYASKDYVTGYLKNYLILPNAKNKWLLSKLIIMPFIIIMLYLGLFISSAIGTAIIKNPMPDNYADIFTYMARLSLPSVAFAFFCVFLTVAFQSKTPALIVAVLLSANIQVVIYLLIDSSGFFSFRLMDYAFINLVKKLCLTGEFPDNLIWVSSALAALSVALSFTIINKKDLKL